MGRRRARFAGPAGRSLHPASPRPPTGWAILCAAPRSPVGGSPPSFSPLSPHRRAGLWRAGPGAAEWWKRERPRGAVRGRREIHVGTAYRIRTGDLRLERAVSWASRRMRRGREYSNGLLAHAPGSQPVRLEEPPDGIGDLAERLLADDGPVVGMRPEGLVIGLQPGRHPLALAFGEETVEAGPDHHPRQPHDRLPV